MTKVVNTVRSRFALLRRYNQTLAELRALSDRDLADLGMSRGDFRRIASEAVYG